MSQTATETEEATAARDAKRSDDPLFSQMFGRYARKDGSKIVLTIEQDDLKNIGQLVVQAVFGYMLNQIQQGENMPAAVLTASLNASEKSL